MVSIVQRGQWPLSARCRILTQEDKSLMEAVASELLETLTYTETAHHFSKGIGLAAPQIGHAVRMFAIRFPNEVPNVYVNPEVTSASRDSDTQYEGCLSFFDVRGRVARHRRISIRYFDVEFKAHEVEWADGRARLAQHELDHLDGVLIVDYS